MSTIVNSPLQGDTRLPLYQRLADTIRKEIVDRIRRPGDRLPSENVIAEQYGIAPGTTRQALAKLVEEGILERFHGKGTFVKAPDFDQSLFRFFRVHGPDGERVHPESRILSREIKSLPHSIAAKLELEENDSGICLDRLRLIDGLAFLTEEIWLPLEPFRNFLEIPLVEIGSLLYPIYDLKCGLTVARAEEVFTVQTADLKTAEILQIDTAEPIVTIDRLAFGYEGKPLEWRRSKGRASQFQYRVEIR